jgi:predicted Ser/Thr protein kinase/GAF domain-containing protein
MTPRIDPAADRPDSGKLPGWWWITAAFVALGLTYLMVTAVGVQPYLAPAGHGAIVRGDAAGSAAGDSGLFGPRPPNLTDERTAVGTVLRVTPGSPAALAGLVAGDRILATGPESVGTLTAPAVDPATRLLRWRAAYRAGVAGPVTLRVQDRDGHVRSATVDRRAAWELDGDAFSEWLALRAGLLVQITLFILSGAAILLLRPRDVTAHFAIVALVLCGVSSGGPLLGAEQSLGAILGRALTLFTWLSTPLAFAAIALAIEYFPRRSALLERHPVVHVLPFIVIAPMLVTTTLTGLFVAGVDGLLPAAMWDATHPALFFVNFAVGLMLNMAVMGKTVARFRGIEDPNDRRKLALAVQTAVVGMLAYAVLAGAPAVSVVLTGAAFAWPWWLALPLYLISALPALGLTYAVVVHRVLSPHNVLRRSLQYALARRTLAVAAVLPAVLLVVSLVEQRNRSLAEIVGGRRLVDAGLLAALLVAFRFRDRATAWLDRRFFRAEYDARGILVSLAGRIPFETDPHELTSLVLSQIDQALHPSVGAVLVSGLEAGWLVPVSTLHGRAEKLADAGPLATLLAWSDQPLDLDLDDTRSPARRLPPDEAAWVSESGAALLVPLISKDRETRTLLGAIVLGAKRSDEPYTAEDRELLASIAAQVSLGLDVARLRRRETAADMMTSPTPGGGADLPVVECPTCRVCYDAGTLVCPADRTPLRAGAVPRTVDSKYRVDRLLGAGGMGAVYLAHDMRLDRDVAIKVVRAELLANPDARARFRREAQMVARLQHPGIVSVFDYGTLAGGAAFLVMEYVRGRDLRALVTEGPQSPATVARLLAAIAEPVDAAHQLGILHRDLKPENILLPEAGIVAAKVLDFGVAKAVGDAAEQTGGAFLTSLTAVGQPVGTPAYMAPEQLAGGTLSERTDIYALGVIGYELLTGALPYGRGSFVDIAMRQMQAPPAFERPDVPDALRTAVVDALSADPSGRPPSARALADRVRGAA